MDVIQPPLSQPFQNRINHNRLICLNQEKKFTLQYTCQITLLPLLSPLTPLSAILVLLLILISLSPTTSPNSPAPASCTSVKSAASDPCLTLKLPPPFTPSSSILNQITATPYFSISLPNAASGAYPNSLARAVTRTSRHHHITIDLKSLHWLKNAFDYIKI